VDRQLSFDLANATAGKLMTPQNSSSSKPYQSGINSRPSSGTLSSQYSTGPAVKNPGSYQRSYEIAPSGSFGASNLNSSTASVRLALPDGLSPYVLSASDFSAKPYRLVEMSRAFLTSQVHLSNDVIEELSAYGSTHTRCAMSESKNNTEK
jgi:hypothetical protein